MQTSKLNIGTRGSPLAVAQAEETRDKLVAAHGMDPDDIDIVIITTTGDKIRDRPLAEIGGKGLFTKEIEEALYDKRIDLAVHSMKDMPAELPPGLEIVCLLEREDPRDAFVSPVAKRVQDLPQGAVVGSSSVRRGAQIRRARPDLEIVPYRGNVNTRLRKLKAGEVSATLLACAGLHRLGMADEITLALPVDEMVPAVAQGAIGVEIRADDMQARELLAAIDHAETGITVAAERGFQCALDGSCRTPLAGHAVLEGDEVVFHGLALTEDGTEAFEARRRGGHADAEEMGRDAAEEVRQLAGGRLFA